MASTRTDQITAPDGDRFDGFVVVPDTGTGPGILLLQEIFGVNEFLKSKADDLAALGYVVLCPDVFWRVERNVDLAHDEAGLGMAFEYMNKWSSIDFAVTSGDLGAAFAHLRALPEVVGRCAAMGYCLGGRLAYEIAVAHGPDTAVSYYGSGIASRLDLADQITCPILFHFGGSDPFIPNEEVDQIREVLGSRPDVEIHVEESAGHAFENFLAPQFHNADAAARSWAITVEFLSRTL